MDRPWPRGTSSMFFIWSSIWATLLSLFSIRRRSEKSASRERERGQNTRSAWMKGGAQKHWRQNGFHSHSGGRPEVPYFFLACLFAIISSTLSSLRHGIWLRGTLSNIKAVHMGATSACDKLGFFLDGRGRGGLCANLHKPGSQRQRERGNEFCRKRAQTVDFTRQVTPRYTRDVQTPG